MPLFEVIITTPTLIKHNIILSVWCGSASHVKAFAATEHRFFVTFWTYWINQTVTSTLLIKLQAQYHPCLQANAVFHLFSQQPFLCH